MSKWGWATAGAVLWSATVFAAWLVGYLQGTPGPQVPRGLAVPSAPTRRPSPPSRAARSRSAPSAAIPPTASRAAAPARAPTPTPGNWTTALALAARSAWPASASASGWIAFEAVDGTQFAVTTPAGTEWVTAGHVVATWGAGAYRLRTHITEDIGGGWQPDEWHSVTLYPEADVATVPAPVAIGVPGLPLANRVPPLGTRLCVVGNAGGRWQATGMAQIVCGPLTAWVPQLRETPGIGWPGAMIPLAGTLAVPDQSWAGMSGAPVVEATGTCVGVVVAGSPGALDFVPLAPNGTPVMPGPSEVLP